MPDADRVELDAADLGIISHASLHQAQAGLAPPVGARLVQRTSHLAAPLDDPFTCGRIAAAHALMALHASGAQPWSATAVVTPPAGAAEAARADVLAMLQGASEVLEMDGARLVDCTTAGGTAAAVSLMLTGIAAPGDAAASLQPGDSLILTKPLGSGALLHGYQRGFVEARWLLGAIEVMVGSSATAAQILQQQGATASATVAAHGTIGALMELLRKANLAAALVPGAIPALPGALALLRRGRTHPLAVANGRMWPEAPDRPEVALLMDPQIAGGLLAGVPAWRAASCLTALHDAGYDAMIIGETETRRLEVPRLRLLEDAEGS